MPPPAPALPKPSKAPEATRRIMEKLWQQHPNADTELHFSNPYELLVATILSAQCTDERVNQVTPALFKRYPDARVLARATTDELEPQIQSTGFFRAKSRSLVGMAAGLVERHGGEVPASMEDLVKLPGVGRKTANVVLGHALGVPGLPVDRHVLRVSNRIGIARSEDPEIVEQQLCRALPPELWTRTSDALILHGRRICKPRPLCERCTVRAECDFYQKVIRPSALAPAAPRAKLTTGGPEGSNPPKHRRATRLQRTGRGVGPAGSRPESGNALKRGRAAKLRGTGHGGGASQNRPESGNALKDGRATKLRGRGRGDGAPQSRSENGTMLTEPRAPRARGTGRGGGAPRQTKK